MKKEKHVLYRWVLGALMLLLALGIVMLVLGLEIGPDAILLSRGTSI